jgi:hypothetical protein
VAQEEGLKLLPGWGIHVPIAVAGVNVAGIKGVVLFAGPRGDISEFQIGVFPKQAPVASSGLEQRRTDAKRNAGAALGTVGAIKMGPAPSEAKA